MKRTRIPQLEFGAWNSFGAWVLGFGALILLSPSTTVSRAADPPKPPLLDLRPNDHVVLIGNALADRFQHSGWLETFIQAKYPNHDLVFRNLAMAGDEVAFRHRPENFGSPDDWLKKTQADVIFAFF